MGVVNSSYTLMRVFSATKRRPSSVERYLRRHYPRVYEFLAACVARGECPFCGRRVKGRLGLAGHMKSLRCRNYWAMLADMISGRKRASEDEVMRFIMSVRRSEAVARGGEE